MGERENTDRGKKRLSGEKYSGSEGGKNTRSFEGSSKKHFDIRTYTKKYKKKVKPNWLFSHISSEFGQI